MNTKFKTATLAAFDKNGLEYKTIRELHDAVKELKDISFGGRDFVALVTFTAKTFADPYTPEQRTYVLGSDSPFFDGKPLFEGEPALVGDALTDDDPGVYILENIEGKFGTKWEVEKCIIPSIKGYLVPRAMILPSAREAFATVMGREVLRTWKADARCKPEEAQKKAEAMVASIFDGSYHFWHDASMKIEGTPWPEDADFYKRTPGAKAKAAKRAAFVEEHNEILANLAPKPAKPKAEAAKPSAPAKGAGKRATAATAPTKPAAKAAPAKAAKPAPATKHEKRLPTAKPAPAKAAKTGKAKPAAKKPESAAAKIKSPAFHAANAKALPGKPAKAAAKKPARK